MPEPSDEFSVNLSQAPMSCVFDCDSLMDLGPPPDLIASMPPPPIPAFLRDPVELLMATNGTCDLCGWAQGDDVHLVEVTRKSPAIDDMWYFVIVSAAVGAVLFGILIVIATLRCKEAKVKPVHGSCSKLEKVHNGRVGVDQVSPPPLPPLGPLPPPPTSTLGGPGGNVLVPKVLWSGLKAGDSPAYALHHHPVNPKFLAHYEKVDYGSVGHTRPPHLSPSCKMTTTPPPLPANPPPPMCPSYCAQSETGVHIMGNGNAYYANPESLDGSFENSGYVDSECSMEVRRIAPDGAIVSRKGRGGCLTPVRGGGGGWEVEAVLRHRFEMLVAADSSPPQHHHHHHHHHHHRLPLSQLHPQSDEPTKGTVGSATAVCVELCKGRGGGAAGFALPPMTRLVHDHFQVSSPLV